MGSAGNLPSTQRKQVWHLLALRARMWHLLALRARMQGLMARLSQVLVREIQIALPIVELDSVLA